MFDIPSKIRSESVFAATICKQVKTRPPDARNAERFQDLEVDSVQRPQGCAHGERERERPPLDTVAQHIKSRPLTARHLVSLSQTVKPRGYSVLLIANSSLVPPIWPKRVKRACKYSMGANQQCQHESKGQVKTRGFIPKLKTERTMQAG